MRRHHTSNKGATTGTEYCSVAVSPFYHSSHTARHSCPFVYLTFYPYFSPHDTAGYCCCCPTRKIIFLTLSFHHSDFSLLLSLFSTTTTNKKIIIMIFPHSYSYVNHIIFKSRKLYNHILYSLPTHSAGTHATNCISQHPQVQVLHQPCVKPFIRRPQITHQTPHSDTTLSQMSNLLLHTCYSHRH